MKHWGTWALCALALVAQAQTLPPPPQRDPTQPPAGMGEGAAVADEGAVPGVALPLRVNGSNVVVQGGKPFLLVGSRLVAPGQTVESYQLERISETEIWLRDASGTTKVPRFAGVQLQATPVQCTPAAARVSPKKAVKKSTPSPRKMAHPPSPPTGAPRPSRENDPHDC